MDFYESLYKFMCNSIELNKLVEKRIYPLIAKQSSALPYIIYSPISTIYDRNLTCESGLVRQKVQFSITDNTFGKARKLTKILRNLFKDFSGDMCGIKVQAVHNLNELVIDSGTQTQYDVERFTSILELEFIFNE